MRKRVEKHIYIYELYDKNGFLLSSGEGKENYERWVQYYGKDRLLPKEKFVTLLSYKELPAGNYVMEFRHHYIYMLR